MRQVVADNLAAVWYMMDLALGIEGLDGFGTLTFIVEDNETSEPLEATIIVDALEHPVLKPRHTNRINGRFDWLLEADQYDITIKKHGYETQTFEDYEITDGERTVLEVSMESIEPVTVRFRTIDLDSATVASRIMLDDSDGNRVFDMEWNFNGEPSLDLQPMLYDMTITSPGYLPIVCPLEVTEDAELSYTLLITEIDFVEDFNSHGEWQRGGDNEDWGVVTFEGRTALTESVTGDYPTDAEVWLQIYDAASLDNVSGAVLELIHRTYFEPGYDYGTFEFFTDFEDITVVQFSQFPEDWDTLYFNLDDLERGMLQIRFEVTSDHAIGEDGWLIDKVTVYKAEYENKVAVQTVIPMEFSLTTYPNPFNSTTTITYSLPVASLVSLQLYDIAGRNIRTLFEGNRQAGVHTVNLDAGEMPSGIYLIKLEGSGQVMLRKVTFLK